MKKILVFIFVSMLLINGCNNANLNNTTNKTTNKPLSVEKAIDETAKDFEFIIPNGEIIGIWLDELYPSKNIIYIEKNQYKLRQSFSDGSYGDIILTKDGDIYFYDNEDGAFYEIEDDRTLSLKDALGEIVNMKRLN